MPRVLYNARSSTECPEFYKMLNSPFNFDNSGSRIANPRIRLWGRAGHGCGFLIPCAFYLQLLKPSPCFQVYCPANLVEVEEAVVGEH